MLENESKFVFYILIILYHKRLFFMTKEAVMLAHSPFHVIFFPLLFRIYIKYRYIFVSGENMDESAITRLCYSRDTQEVENTQLLT